jgi:hypothetical protein
MGEHVMAAVLAAEAAGAAQLYEVGVLSARETVRECDRLLALACPSDAIAQLRILRATASRQLH